MSSSYASSQNPSQNTQKSNIGHQPNRHNNFTINNITNTNSNYNNPINNIYITNQPPIAGRHNNGQDINKGTLPIAIPNTKVTVFHKPSISNSSSPSRRSSSSSPVGTDKKPPVVPKGERELRTYGTHLEN